VYWSIMYLRDTLLHNRGSHRKNWWNTLWDNLQIIAAWITCGMRDLWFRSRSNLEFDYNIPLWSNCVVVTHMPGMIELWFKIHEDFFWFCVLIQSWIYEYVLFMRSELLRVRSRICVSASLLSSAVCVIQWSVSGISGSLSISGADPMPYLGYPWSIYWLLMWVCVGDRDLFARDMSINN
jgi:hypothetical protein